MRRWTLLLAGAALWLFLAAIPALADGGPHVSSANSGVSTLTADSCAGCHRAHTAQGAMLLKTSEEDLCLTCHGSAGVGASTDVEAGIQYKVALAPGSAGQNPGDAAVVAGALRAGGFVSPRISSGSPIRLTLPRWSTEGTPELTDDKYVASFSSKVPVAASGSSATSAHLKLHSATGVDLNPSVETTDTAWGNGTAAGVGPDVALECTSCHNPHGNNQYRILNPIPSPTATSGIFTAASANAVVADVRPFTGQVRNYTVKWGATLTDAAAGSPTDGDYWRRYQPYDIVPTRDPAFNPAIAANCPGGTNVPPFNCPTLNPTGYFRGDMPEFVPAGTAGASGSSTTWRNSITAWCSTCHTRYNTQTGAFGVPAGGYPSGGSYNTDSGDAIFKYRHGTSNSECTQCHVAHGSNAVMPGQDGTTYSAAYPYPGGTINDSSRLLKVNNRGTCQQCHDPTGTIPSP